MLLIQILHMPATRQSAGDATPRCCYAWPHKLCESLARFQRKSRHPGCPLCSSQWPHRMCGGPPPCQPFLHGASLCMVCVCTLVPEEASSATSSAMGVGEVVSSGKCGWISEAAHAEAQVQARATTKSVLSVSVGSPAALLMLCHTDLIQKEILTATVYYSTGKARQGAVRGPHRGSSRAHARA